MGPTWPRWDPCWPHEYCYLGSFGGDKYITLTISINNEWQLVTQPIHTVLIFLIGSCYCSLFKTASPILTKVNVPGFTKSVDRFSVQQYIDVWSIFDPTEKIRNLTYRHLHYTDVNHTRQFVSNYRQLSYFKLASKISWNVRIACPFWGESTADRWIPLTEGKYSGKRLHVMAS